MFSQVWPGENAELTIRKGDKFTIDALVSTLARIGKHVPFAVH